MKTTKVPADSVYSTMTSVHGVDPHNGGGNSEDPTNIPPSIEVTMQEVDFDDQRLTNVLQRLADDAELHKLLSDEKMRCEIHRSNYEKLKAEYLKLAHKTKHLEAEAAGLEAKKVTVEQDAQLAEEKFLKEMEQLKAQIGSLQSQVPTDAEKFLMDRELKNKYDTVWRDRLTNLMEDLEAAKLTIHNLTQENMNLHITIQKQSEETQRMSDEAKMMLEAQIDRLKSENERLANTQRPQIKALETEVASMTKTNVKLRHQIQVYEEQCMEAEAQNSRQTETISRQEQEINQLEKSSSTTVKRLEVENSSLQLHASKLEQQLLEAKLYSHDLQSELKQKTNEIVSSKQTIEVAKTEADAKLCRQKLEAAKEVSRLETEVDKLKILLRESREKATKLDSELEVLKIENEKQKLENEQNIQNAQRDLSSTIASLEVRQSELVERLKATQKQLAHEKILRQQKEREVQSNLDLLDRQGQEMDLLKALLAKLQKYERDLDQKHIPTEQNKQNKEEINKNILDDYQRLKHKYDQLQDSHRKFAHLLHQVPSSYKKI